MSRGRRAAAAFMVVASVLVLGTALGWAVSGELQPLPGSEDCAACHDPRPEGAQRVPGEPPPFGAEALRASPHAGVDCRACHADLEGAELPHPARLSPAACGSCHETAEKEYVESLHGRAAARGETLAPRCRDCHGSHDILSSRDPLSSTYTFNVPVLCGRCHHEGSPVQIRYHVPQDSILQNYSESIHGEGLYQKGLLTTAVCTSCHTAHHVLPHTDSRSSIAHRNVAATCMQCHVRIEAVHRKVIRGELWEKQPDVIPVCVDCHSPHRIRKVFYTQGMSDRDCLSCHARRDLEGHRGEETVSMYVDAAELAGSRHSKTACSQCHTGGNPAEVRPCRTMTGKVDCSICHAEVVETYRRGKHGELAAAGSPDAPVCADCHGTHGTLGHRQTESPTYARHIPALCGGCHRTGQKAAARYRGSDTLAVEQYMESIHGKGLLESGLTVTATCVDCHSAHGELPSADAASTVNRANVALTCAQCHRGIYELYQRSIHSPAVSSSQEALPTCSDCHSAHAIGRTDREDFRMQIMNQCGRCHQELAERYFDTYHGKVSRLGYLKTAQCYDCHGAHDILPVWNPASRLSRHNIVATCGQCHPGSNRRFAGYLTHATHHDPHKYPALFWTFWGMTGLLIGTFVVAGLHTLAWLPRSFHYRRELRRRHATESAQHIRRFPLFYRNLHLMVIVSFLGLALTGMTLKFSYAGWARMLSRLFGGFEAAGLIHRACALITFAYFALHLWDLIRRRRASGLSWWRFVTGPNGMLFSKTDLLEFGQSVRWFFARGPRPSYGRWTYWEKFDYFAVFWGVAVIGSTGLLLWFPTFFTRFLPGSFLNVATIIHSDEALLAVGFIFTVHFFNTHFRPEKFPIDTVIFTGGVPREEYAADRPREYEELVASGELAARLAPAPSARAVRWWRVFGFTALTIGICLILAIVYAALFIYR